MYLRISLDSTGEERAISRQREDALALIESKRWELFEIYVDNSVSASRREKKRPAYDRMIADYAAGRFGVIVTYDLDRLTRQPAQLEHWIEAAETRGLRIVTLNGEADLGTDAGRLFARLKVAVARAEVERSGSRRRRANAQTVADGRPAPGRRPYGWKADGVTIRKREAAVVRRIYAAVLDGQSLRSLTRELNEHGVPSPQGTPWTAFKLRQLINRPRNHGALVSLGVERTESKVKGSEQKRSKIKPIVSRDDHERAMAIIASRAQPGRKPEKHALSGLVTCTVCGRPMGAKGLKSRNAGEREPYYICSARINRNEPSDGRTHPTIRAHLLEAEVRRQVVAAMLYAPASVFPGHDDGALADAAQRLQDARARMRQWDDVFEAREMTRAHWRERRAPLEREETAALAAQVEAQARAAVGSFADIRRGVFVPGSRVDLAHVSDVRDRLGQAYDALSFDARRDLVRHLLSITVSPGYGIRRASIEHLVVVSLNDDPDALDTIEHVETVTTERTV